MSGKIELNCIGCGKNFSIWPYLKRKTNYCSIKCYLDSTRSKVKCVCKICDRRFLVKKYLKDQGYGIYCSRKCQHKTYPSKIKKICPKCGKKFEVQPSITNLRKYCSKKCRDDAKRDYVKSVCKKCGKKFKLPRSDFNRGRGNFCTYRCYLTYRGPSSLEEKMEKALRLAKIKFEREVKFKRFHADFLLDGLKTVIECDGEHWHLNPKNIDRDNRKDELLKSLGYKVLRFSGRMMGNFTYKELGSVIKENVSKF